MARIPEAEIGRLKSEISLQRLAEAKGVVLRKRGDELMGLCPFHEDHSPSLVINPGKNVWHCLGACQAGGSVIDWVMKSEGVSFREAVALLREGLPSLAADVSKTVPSAKIKFAVAQNVDAYAQLKQTIDYYHETLKQSPDALAYLGKRGLGSSEMIERFHLGYCDRTLGCRLPEKNRKAGAEIRGCLEAMGILRASGHEHFRGSLVIPVFDEGGFVTEVYGRKIGDRLRKGTPLHLYLPGPHRGVWNIEALKGSKEIILCESLIDALTFWCAGFRNVTASYGIEGFTGEHHAAFKSHGIERVMIAYDRDEAGDRAASSLAAKLMEEGIECFRIQFPRGMDANAYALQVKPAEKSLGLVMRNAVWMGKGKGAEKTATKEENNIGLDSSHTAYRFSESPLNKGGLGDSSVSDEAEKAEEETKSPRPPSRKGEITATSLPEASASLPDAEVKPGEVVICFGDRRWRIRGLEKNLSYSLLKVNLLVSRESRDAFHVDTFDLYAARQRQVFIKQAGDELGVKDDVIKKDLGKVLLELEALQDRQINQTLKSKDGDKPAVALSRGEKSAAMSLLKDPKLLDRILSDFEKCGVVGEETNKLVGYLAAVSRKLEEPLAIVIQSSSAAGKSSLMEAILSFFPQEERVQYSAMTGQSLFYMGEADLQHKILAIAEEEGAEKATYALKLLQSEGVLTIASTGKDPSTGRLETQEYRVEGPVMIFLTTTAIEIDEELLNRCIVLTVDEEREQTRAIHRLQRERQTLEGLLARRDSEEIKKLHQDAQRLLRPLLVANPFAKKLTFFDNLTRTRRDHMKYLTLIRAVALLHQHQRPIKDVTHKGKPMKYIEVTLEDIEIANTLANQVLGRSLDELAPQSRRLLMAVDEMVTARCEAQGVDREDYWFTRREVREYTGYGNTQLKIHMHRLEELEYLIVHRGGRGQQFVYELAYKGEGKSGESFITGLLDVVRLKQCEYDTNRSGVNGDLSDTGRGQVGPKSGGCRGATRPLLSNDSQEVKPLNGKTQKIAYQEPSLNTPYSQHHTDTSVAAKGAE